MKEKKRLFKLLLLRGNLGGQVSNWNFMPNEHFQRNTSLAFWMSSFRVSQLILEVCHDVHLFLNQSLSKETKAYFVSGALFHKELNC